MLRANCKECVHVQHRHGCLDSLLQRPTLKAFTWQNRKLWWWATFFGLGVGGGGRVGSVFTMFPWCEFIICIFPGIQPSVCSCQLAGCWWLQNFPWHLLDAITLCVSASIQEVTKLDVRFFFFWYFFKPALKQKTKNKTFPVMS